MQPKNTILKIIITLLFLAAMIFSFTACSPGKKAHKYFENHPKEFAKDCADAFPVTESVVVKDSTVYDTLYIPGEPLTDTLWRDSIAYITKRYYDTVYYSATHYHDSIITKRDSAGMEAMRQEITESKKLMTEALLQLNKKDEKINELKSGRNKWRLWCIITWTVIAAGTVLKIWLKIKI